MTREQLREARAQAVQRHSRALQDDWRKALPRLLDELDTLDEQYAAVKAAGKPAAPPEAATTPRRARK